MALDVLVPFSVPFLLPQFHLCVSLVCLVPPVVLCCVVFNLPRLVMPDVLPLFLLAFVASVSCFCNLTSRNAALLLFYQLQMFPVFLLFSFIFDSPLKSLSRVYMKYVKILQPRRQKLHV